MNPKILMVNNEELSPINPDINPTTTGPSAPPPDDPIPQTIPDDKFEECFGTRSPIREMVKGNRLYVKKPYAINQIIDG